MELRIENTWGCKKRLEKFVCGWENLWVFFSINISWLEVGWVAHAYLPVLGWRSQANSRLVLASTANSRPAWDT